MIKCFRNDTFEKKTITATEVVLTQLLSYNVVSKHKNKNKNTEYHGMFVSFKSHLYSKQGSPIFLVFGSWSLALYLLVWVEVTYIFFSIISFLAKLRHLRFSMVEQLPSRLTKVGSKRSIHLIRKTFPVFNIYLVVKNHKKNHTYLTVSQ